MPITTALTLYEEAKKGKALTTAERRSVIYYLQATKPTMQSDEIAELFGISLKKLQKDQLEIRKRISEEVKQTTVDMVVAEVHDSFKRLLKKLENNVVVLEERKQQGTDTYTRAAVAALDGVTKYHKLCQEVGLIPKDNTAQTTVEYHWVAGVDDTGKAYTEQKVITKETSKEKIINVTTEADSVSETGLTPIISGTK